MGEPEPEIEQRKVLSCPREVAQVIDACNTTLGELPTVTDEIEKQCSEMGGSSPTPFKVYTDDAHYYCAGYYCCPGMKKEGKKVGKKGKSGKGGKTGKTSKEGKTGKSGKK